MIAAAVLLALVAGGAAAAYFAVIKKPGDISNPDVPFIGAEPTPAPEQQQAKTKPNRFRWPRYGFTKDHNRNFTPAKAIRGPFRAKWKRKASALTEFPPAISQN